MPDAGEELSKSVDSLDLPPPNSDNEAKVTVQYTHRPKPQAAAVPALSSADSHEDCLKQMQLWSNTEPDFKIILTRRTPSSHEGRVVRTGTLQTYPIMDFRELEEEIRNNYGGGSYHILIQDGSGLRRHQTKFTIPTNELPPVTVNGSNGSSSGHESHGGPGSDVRRDLEIRKMRIEADEMEAKHEERMRQMREEREAAAERREASRNKPTDELLAQFRKIEERHEKEMKEIREESRRMQEQHMTMMREMANGQKDSPMLAEALKTLGTMLTAVLTKDNGSDKLAEAMRESARASVESSRDMVRLIMESKKDNGGDDRMFGLLTTVMQAQNNKEVNRMQVFQEGMNMGLELIERMGPSGAEDNPDAGFMEKLGSGLLRFLNNNSQGREIASRFLGKAVGALTQQDLKDAAQGMAPTIAQEMQTGNGADPVFKIHGQQTPQFNPPQPALTHTPQHQLPPPDPYAAIRQALNNTLQLAVNELKAGSPYHTWPDYAQQNLHPQFLEQLTALPDDQKFGFVRQYADPAIFSELQTLVMGPHGGNFVTALERLCDSGGTN